MSAWTCLYTSGKALLVFLGLHSTDAIICLLPVNGNRHLHHDGPITLILKNFSRRCPWPKRRAKEAWNFLQDMSMFLFARLFSSFFVLTSTLVGLLTFSAVLVRLRGSTFFFLSEVSLLTLNISVEGSAETFAIHHARHSTNLCYHVDSLFVKLAQEVFVHRHQGRTQITKICIYLKFLRGKVESNSWFQLSASGVQKSRQRAEVVDVK